ncbi:energy transducer TonB [Thalassomonas actiniarum]|uniref:Protein TonB n=1 Tax=Thalassomonas actiniarum TaxID=485447 RepID=A0AAE9YS29_9GAMM|nr:energy transducer TonB [Thalassomonas actiniarum]WDD99239.1 TonB family protein [Thalassomonas actiniarum]
MNKNAEAQDLAFEQEIHALYQQRKNQLQPPEIKLSGQGMAGSSYLAWMRPLLFLFGGGVVSFGLMALVSHFAGYQQQTQAVPEPEQRFIHLAPEPEPEEQQAVIAVIPPLPPKVVPQPPEVSPVLTADRHQQVGNSGEFNWQVNTSQETAFPELKQPGLALTPTYKVMPEYSVKARQKGQQGEVKLGYKINQAGQVTDIQVIDASVGRELQKLSRQALAKWRYQPGTAAGQQHQVVFEFSLNGG